MSKTVFAAVLAASALSLSAAAITIEPGNTKTRYSSNYFPKSASAITYAGGDTYYVVADNATPDDNCPYEVGLYRVTMTFSDNGKTVETYSCSSRIDLSMVSDLEGVAYDPASGNIWASDEVQQSIREYDVTSGAIVSTLDVPSVLKKTQGNFGFESLTISGDGLTMWTANEESLSCDGPRSSYRVSATNRLVKFTRTTVNDRWQLVAMYPYVTDTWTLPYNYSNKARRGIADMCALPDGSLLVMERELSSSTGGALGVSMYYTIYRITQAAMDAASNVKDVGSLKTGGWRKIEKGTPLAIEDSGWGNFEGICLGKRLSSDSCELVMLTDAGNHWAMSKQLKANVIKGLNVHTVSFEFNSPIGNSSLVGQNYRFMHGASVTVRAYGDGIDERAYTNRGDTVSSAVWSLQHHTPSSGYGPTTTFTVNTDDVFTYNVYVSGCHGQWGEDAPIFMHDTFEEYAPGTFGNAISRWSGEGEIMAKTYTPYQGIGKVLPRADHSKVLNAEDEAIRDISSIYLSQSDNLRMDMMVEVRKAPEPLEPMPSNVRLAIATDNYGKLQLWHYGRFRGQLKFDWSPLGDTAYANGTWVRVSIERGYTSARAYGRVWVNGVARAVTGGNSTQALNTGSSLVSGQWFPLYTKNLPTTLTAVGTKVDDFVLAMPSFFSTSAAQSIVVAPGKTNGAESSGPTFTVAVAVPAAAAPVAARPRSASSTAADRSAEPADAVSAPAITGFGLTADSRPRIRFTGFAEGAVYRVVRSASLDFKGEDVECLDGDVTGSENGVAVWEGKYACDPSAGAKFYRIEVVK